MRKRIWLIGGTVILVAVLVWLQFGRPKAPPRVYRMGWTDSPPFEVRGADGQPTGLAVDLVRTAARRRGISLEWVYWGHSSERALREKVVDLWPLMTITPERLQHFYVSEPYIEAEFCLLVRANSRYARMQDLATATISFADRPVDSWQLDRHLPHVLKRSRGNRSEVMEDLCQQRSDAAFMTTFAGIATLLEPRGSCGEQALRWIAAPEIRSRLGIAAPPEFRGTADALREEIGTIAAEGTLATILGQSGYMSQQLESMEALLQARRRGQRLAAAALIFAFLFTAACWQSVRFRRETKRTRQTEQALRETEQRLRLMANSMREMVLAYDMNRRLVFANPAVETLTGYRIADLERERFVNWIHPDDQARMLGHWDAMFQGSGFEDEEYRLIARDGRTKWVSATWGPIRDDAGRQVGVQGSERDITERRLAEEALREDEQRLVSIYSTVGDVIFHLAVEPEGQFRFVSVNPAFLRVTGLSSEMVVGKTVSEVIPEPSLTMVLGKYRQAIEENAIVRWEETSDYPAGRMTGEVSIAPVFDPQGTCTHLVGSVHDITERKQAEEALRAREEVLSESQRIAHVGSWSWDLATGTTVWTPESYRVFGVSPDTFVPSAETFLSLIHPDDRAAMQAWIGACLAGEGPPDLEFRARPPDGSVRHVLGRGHLVQAAENKPIRMAGIAQDITERKRAEAALRESEYRYRSLFEQSGDFILLLEPADGPPLIVDANQTALRGYGYSREEMVGQSVSLVEPGITRETVEERRRLLAEGKPIYMRHRRKDGSTFDLESMAQRVRIGGRDIVLVVQRDITERKRAEEERAHLQLQLAQAQKMESIGRLAGGVAHDFNNLLTVINGYSRMLLAKLSAGDPLRAKLEQIRKAGERAVGLTRQLLAFSRKQILEPRVLDLNRLVEEMRPMLERLVGEDVEVRAALHAECGTILADPHQLEQVVMNLAVNSRDAMPRGGRLSIETANVERDESYTRSHPDARVGRYVMLAVSDTGVGLDEETKDRIFEPFFTTKGVGKGTGLGLSMVQGIVAQSGGHIEVHSEKGQGTTFKIYLPALADATAKAETPAEAAALGGKETVLVVEDQAEVRDYTIAALKEYGYRVIAAENAGAALLLCERERERIDLLLTDVVMPNVSGRELADRLATLRPGIKVLFMSGYTDDKIVQHGVLEEGAELIQKPFSPEDVARKVRKVLGPPVPAARIAS